MTITFDPGSLAQLLDLPLGTALWRLIFWYFGWLPVAIVMLNGVIAIWLFNRRQHWEHHQKFILLAIDVPRNNQQSLLAVENLFTYFAGAHGSFTLVEKWWHGKIQLGFSFEIVSIGGYIQYLIRTPEAFRNLVESAVYSQYPDAEIYEVEDYTKLAPNTYPDEEYDIWGSEFVQVANEMLPIKTYPMFEHDFGEKETKFRDPMTALMDLMSSLKKGEQLWYQIIVVPTDTSWTKHADHFIDEMLGKGHGTTKANDIVDKILVWIGDISEMIYQLWGHVDDKHESSTVIKFPELPPGPKNKLEAVYKKVAKMGFEATIRTIYFSRRDVMNKPKVVNGFVGYIKQFNSNELNALKPDTKSTMTSAAYFFTEQRIKRKKENIMRGYKQRSDLIGRPPWIMNVEELATLWHFPLDAVTKAPLINRAAGKRIEPPMSLPMDAGRGALSKTDPIFDEGYDIMDDEPATHDHGHEAKPQTASGKPGFFDDEDDEPAGEVPAHGQAEPEMKEPAATVVPEVGETVTHFQLEPPQPQAAPEQPVSQPAQPRARGEAPSNLPFE